MGFQLILCWQRVNVNQAEHVKVAKVSGSNWEMGAGQAASFHEVKHKSECPDT